MDEAGRGCLAGPVVVAGLAWEREWAYKQPFFEHLNDSKQLSVKERELLYNQLLQSEIHAQVVVVSPFWIDSFNILKSTLLGFEKSYPLPRVVPTYIDGNHVPVSMRWARPEIGGDARIPVIMAASILAKVARDRLMQAWAERLPDYDFKRHKGYGTAKHLQALQTFGPSPIHRKTFRPVREILPASWPEGRDHLMSIQDPLQAFRLYMQRYHEIPLEHDPELLRYFIGCGLWSNASKPEFRYLPLKTHSPSGISLAFSPSTSGDSP
ncbi:MAG: ribonuclease HII [Acidobacteria bacterium]|nr:ribonuclease HII [Acidobacteriota bacterium]MCB9398199.1 ribonuclease HII [Acidobacteriota bacterium]